MHIKNLRGGVKVPTGGHSPRVDSSIDLVKVQGRQLKSGWEKVS
jgi:hypothetical protein